MLEKLSVFSGGIAALQLSLWAMVCLASGPAHGNDVRKIHSGARRVEFAAVIMSVDHANRHIIINEKRIAVGHYRFNNKDWATRMSDEKGNFTALDRFGPGQWVGVRGFAISKSEIFAISVRTDSGYLRKVHDHIEKLK